MLMDCASACLTWKEFYTRFPLAYSSAKKRRLLYALQVHCGYTTDGWKVYDAPNTPCLESLLQDHGLELPEAFHDPKWFLAEEPEKDTNPSKPVRLQVPF